MVSIFRLSNKLFSANGLLAIFPLVNYIVNAFSNGWDRNRAIDVTGGVNNNALMGGYLLAASNTTLSITGILTTDTIIALTPNGLVGTVAVTGTMTFVAGQSYGAFEVYRGGALIGRYCLTERQGLILINQYTGAGALPNAGIGGTTTTVWQRSNAFYSETNERGYSISGTGWVTGTGAAIAVGTIIPADLVNATKCLAWVGGVQQDLQNVGRAKNSISVVPYATYCNGDRYWILGTLTNNNTTNIEYEVYIRTAIVPSNPTSIVAQLYSNTHGIYISSKKIALNFGVHYTILRSDYILSDYTSYKIVAGVTQSQAYVTVIDQFTGAASTNTMSTPHGNIESGNFYIASFNDLTGKFTGYIGNIKITVNGLTKAYVVNNQHGTSFFNTITKLTHNINGVTENLLQNIDLVYNQFNQTGYEIWTNGTDYRIYPLASDGTRFITPAGYTIVETVTAGNMPSVADSRFTTFKYALANSYTVRNSVPEAYNEDAQATPKLLTYAELRALTSNVKVTQTEVNGKITNITIRQ